MVVTAQDLIVIYLPLLGAERGIDVATVGLLLMLRSACAVIARVFYAPIIRAVGRVPLTVLTMTGSSLAYIVLALPVPLYMLYPAMIVIGVGLGIAATLSISNVVDIVPAEARGVALSLRITGNRAGQMLMPIAAGAVAAASGAAGIFYVVAFTLAASGASVHIVRKSKP
jgi:MFS family permease